MVSRYEDLHIKDIYCCVLLWRSIFYFVVRLTLQSVNVY